jgi:predicted DNA-binding transcriptional regulator YafY
MKIDMILSFGDICECMEPPHVREELKKRIESLGRVYGIRDSLTSEI